MKLTSIVCSVLLSGLLLPASTLALDPGSSPLFAGTSLVVHDETFAWDETASSEDGTYRYDIYASTTTSTTLTVTGMLTFTDLATVSGTGVEGFLDYGAYGDLVQIYTEAASAPYTTHDVNVTYMPDLYTGELKSSGTETYTGPTETTTSTWDELGNWSQGSAGASTSSSTGASHTLFGATYAWTGGTWSTSWWGDGMGSGGNANEYHDSYASTDGGTLSVSYSEDSSSGMSGTGINGWDPYAGSFGAGYYGSFTGFDGLTWEPRTAGSFAPNQLWVNGTLVNWVQGEIDQSGTITDTYEESGGGAGLTISGNIRSFTLNGGTASVSGSAGGTVTESGGFTDSSIQTTEPGPQGWTDAEPFFTTAMSLWVDGTEYPFEQGYQDEDGNRTDTYVNASAGTVTLTGHTSDAASATVQVTHLGGTDSGTYSGGDVFVMSTYVVSIHPPSSYTPEAFWVRGRFYTRAAAGSTTYETAAGSGASATLTVTDNHDGTYAVAGTDATGTFSGTYESNHLGLFLLEDAQANKVPAVAANTDGSLQLAGNDAPADLPPAVMVVDGRIWTYWGTSPDDLLPATNAAYYGSALHADESQWLMKLRLDGSGTVTYTDYGTGTSAAGTYSTTTHLFQTSAPGSGFPVPVYGVDPTDNNTLWELPQAPAGTPATFLLDGQVWRYAGTDDGAAVYEGYYQGRQLALAAADAEGRRLLTLTDPVNGNTEGTLNDLRGSVRLRDGRVAYSGSFEGEQINPVLDEANLHTINADLDITGNVVTFGALSQSTATAGVTLQFADVAGAEGSLTASLYSMLSRPQAQWVWARASDSGAQTTLPVMRLDASSGLTLYDPAGGGEAGVRLDPAEDGVSSIRGVLRVRPGGDIDMGDFTAGGEP